MIAFNEIINSANIDQPTFGLLIIHVTTWRCIQCCVEFGTVGCYICLLVLLCRLVKNRWSWWEVTKLNA